MYLRFYYIHQHELERPHQTPNDKYVVIHPNAMVRSVGCDPGTKSFDIFGFDDDEVILDVSIPTEEIRNDPRLVAEIISRVEPDFVVGPSGYGIALKNIANIDEDDIFHMSLRRSSDDKSMLGMRNSIEQMQKQGLPVWFIPGVIHLPTVPSFRKLNKIDMGTSDKLCTAVAAIEDYSHTHNCPYEEVSFILLEIGYGYTAALSIEKGQIVDGVGGTTGCTGFMSAGTIDAELAYLMGAVDKKILAGSGAVSMADGSIPGCGVTGITPDEMIASPELYPDVWNVVVEGALKDVFMLYASSGVRDVVLSGRLAALAHVEEGIARGVGIVGAGVSALTGPFGGTLTKHAAHGAAMIADGLSGAKYSELVQRMGIKDATGSCLDHVASPLLEYALRKL